MTILVPIDFSDLSEKALRIASTYANVAGGRITPLHSHAPISEMDDSYSPGMSSHLYQDYENLEKNLRSRLELIARQHIDEQILDPPLIVMGNPAQSIIDLSKDFDLIIMSTHGRTGFSRFLLGSVAEKVLRLAHTPVMVVENESDVDEFKKILVPTDFSESASAAYPYAVNIAKKAGASIDLIHVLSFDPLEEEESDLSLKKIRQERLKLVEKEFFHDLSGRVRSMVLVSEHSPHEAIYHHVKENPYNLIIMATVGRTGIRYLMMGSTTANLVRHVKTAVLSINPRKQ